MWRVLPSSPALTPERINGADESQLRNGNSFVLFFFLTLRGTASPARHMISSTEGTGGGGGGVSVRCRGPLIKYDCII